jgi:hypothetical protein
LFTQPDRINRALSAGGFWSLNLTLKAHPLTRVVLTPFTKEILHDLSAFSFEHSGGDFNSMIQEVRIADSESGFHCTGSFITRAVDKSSYSRLYQRTGAHHARLNGGINNRVNDAIVANPASCFTQGHDFRVCCWILIRAGSVAGNRQHLVTTHDAGADRNFAALSRLVCCDQSLAHPLRVSFSFIGSCHERNILRQTTEKLTIGVALKHCQASGYFGSFTLASEELPQSLGLHRRGLLG